jgi:hypothetical protein
MNVIETIQEKLANIEKEKGVKILYAVESGSRAWGKFNERVLTRTE